MYTIKLLKQSFVSFIFASFEKMGENGPRLEEEVKKDKFPPIVDKKTKETFPPTKDVLENSKNERTKLSDDKLKNISNKEFLAISPNRRLENITKNNIKSEKISSGEVKTLEFSFTFDGKFNKELYLKTTAGQVLPKEVFVVKKDGIIYERSNLSGEFFTPGNKRLIIKEGTKIEIEQIRTADEIKKLEKANKNKITKFKTSDKYKEEFKQFDDIIFEAVKRGINPEFALLAFSEKVKDLAIIDITRPVIIEEMFTEFDRKKGKTDMWNGKLLSNGKYPDDIVVKILKEFGGDKWKNKAKEYGVKDTEINRIQLNSNFSKKEKLSLQRLEGLSENFKGKTKMFLNDVWKQGIGIFITEGYRSQEIQNKLYAQGRTIPGSKVTWTLNSNHTKGKAFDIAFDSDMYGTAYPKSINKWREVADIAKKYGIDWGYDLWGKDKPHFQDNGSKINIDENIDQKLANNVLNEKTNKPKESYKTREEFYALSMSAAKKVESIYGVPWEISFGQSILESGHGESDNAKKYNNFFGHTTTSNKYVQKMDGGILNKFAIYDSVEEGLMAHGEFLKKDRYADAFKYTGKNKNVFKFLEAIADAGYVHKNHDDYPNKIIRVLKSRQIYV